MKKLYLLLCMLSTVFIFAQNQNNNWFFGFNNLITFNPPNVGTISSTIGNNNMEGSASVSDNITGNLLFFTNGTKICKFNAGTGNGDINLNNVDLKGNFSSAQNSIIVPYPGHPGQYFIVTISGKTFVPNNQVTINPPGKQGLYYSIYDLPSNSLMPNAVNSLSDGSQQVDVTYRNESESITSVPHANGVDYWVVTYVKSLEPNAVKPGKFLSFLVNSSGISSVPIVTSFESQSASNTFFAFRVKIAPDNEKIALKFSNNAGLYTGTFNNCTGNIKMNSTSIDNSVNISMEFSPDSNYLYYANNRFNFSNSAITSTMEFSPRQLGPNGRLYGYVANSIRVINNPNDAVLTFFDFNTINNQGLGFPQLVHWQTGAAEVPEFTQIAPICYGDDVPILPTTSNNQISGSWNPSTISNTQTLQYTFTPTGSTECGNTSTMTIEVNQPQVPTFTAIPPICSGGDIATLPMVSNNGIAGTWSPSPVNNTATGTYTFTPNPGTCSIPTEITVVVLECNDDCAGPIVLTSEPNNMHDYNSSATIETSGSYEIDSGKDIKMFASQYIVLKPETHIKSGAFYLGKIKGCGTIESTNRDKFSFGDFCYSSNTAQTSQFSLYDQIIIGGVAANYQDFIIVVPNLPAGVTINQNGTITIAAGLSVNYYSFLFHVCQVSNVSNCSTDWTASFSVLNQITAFDDNITAVLNPSNVVVCGASTLDLLANDTICPSTPVTTSNVDVSLMEDSDYFSITDGTLVIDEATPPGDYQLIYSICLSGTTICSYAFINISVKNSIDAVSDSVTFNTQGVLCCGNSTLTLESFENTSGPNVTVSNNWNLGTGTWRVFDNGVGTTQSWNINNTIATPPLVYAGTNAAYINRENNGAIGLISEDYLSTPLITIPSNAELRFFSRTFTNGNQGTIYQIKFAPASSNPLDPLSYTLVQQFTEDQLTYDYATGIQNVFNKYTEHVVSLSQLSSLSGYISFVKIFNQPSSTIGGDRWLLDDVRILPGDAICDYNVLTNDSVTNCGVNGLVTESNLYNQVANNTVTLSLVSISPPTNNITLNPLNGTISVNPNTSSNTYVLTYNICRNGNICDSATVEVNIVKECIFTKEKSIAVDKYLDNITIYPNPSKDIFNIHFKNEITENIHITVYNMIGQKIIEDKNVDAEKYQINLSDYSSGNYLVKIESDGKLVTKKITKE